MTSAPISTGKPLRSRRARSQSVHRLPRLAARTILLGDGCIEPTSVAGTPCSAAAQCLRMPVAASPVRDLHFPRWVELHLARKRRYVGSRAGATR